MTKFNKQLYLPLSMVLLTILNACSSTSHPEKWMTQNKNKIIDTHISNIKIPGSYRANSYNITGQESLCLGELTNYNNEQSNSYKMIKLSDSNAQITLESALLYINHQDKDIFNQLMGGMRYLDLLVCYQDGTFYTSNYYLTSQLTKIDKQIDKFLHDYPYEIVIINLDKVWDKDGYINEENAKLLINQLEHDFGNRIILNTTEALTFRNVWKNKQNILIMSDNPHLYDSELIWDSNKLIELQTQPEFATIKKLTNIQLGIEKLTSLNESYDLNKLNIFPVYTKFDAEINTPEELQHSQFNRELIIDYLYSLPESNPINIIVGDKYLETELAEYAMNQFQATASPDFKKPKKTTTTNTQSISSPKNPSQVIESEI